MFQDVLLEYKSLNVVRVWVFIKEFLSTTSPLQHDYQTVSVCFDVKVFENINFGKRLTLWSLWKATFTHFLKSYDFSFYTFTQPTSVTCWTWPSLIIDLTCLTQVRYTRLESHVYDEFVPKGNTAVFRCRVVNTLKEIVQVTSWLINEDTIIKPQQSKGRLKSMVNRYTWECTACLYQMIKVWIVSAYSHTVSCKCDCQCESKESIIWKRKVKYIIK